MAKPKIKPPAKTLPVGTIPPEVKRAFDERANLGSTCKWIFEVDYAINSKKPRFFVFHIPTGRLFTYKTAHGRGGKNESPHDGACRQVSNVNGSGCSSVGIIRTLNLYTSAKVGRALRLEGLSSGKNDNIFERGVVLHGGDYVHDNDASNDPDISGRSLGCIVTDERYIHYSDGGELLDILANGSVGVAHLNGKF